MNPPSALYGAMNRERKPFTYTPGGLDLSQIKSERMAKRLMRNAMNQGVPETPTNTNKCVQSSAIPVAIPNYNCLPVQVFPSFQLPANPKSLLRTRSNPDGSKDALNKAIASLQPNQTKFHDTRKGDSIEMMTKNTCNGLENNFYIRSPENNENNKNNEYEFYGTNNFDDKLTTPNINSYDSTSAKPTTSETINLEDINANRLFEDIVQENLVNVSPKQEEYSYDRIVQQEDINAIQSKEENKTENQNGDTETAVVVKLPSKKSAAKTETKVEVVQKSLPDGSIQEIKTTTTRTTIDGKTEITTKTETKTISKDETDEETYEEEEEIEENETNESTTETQKSAESQKSSSEDIKKSVVVSANKESVKENDTVNEPKDIKQNGNIILQEEKTESSSVKKVVIVQSESQESEEELEEEEEEIEEEEAENEEEEVNIIDKSKTSISNTNEKIEKEETLETKEVTTGKISAEKENECFDEINTTNLDEKIESKDEITDDEKEAEHEQEEQSKNKLRKKEMDTENINKNAVSEVDCKGKVDEEEKDTEDTKSQRNIISDDKEEQDVNDKIAETLESESPNKGLEEKESRPISNAEEIIIPVKSETTINTDGNKNEECTRDQHRTQLKDTFTEPSVPLEKVEEVEIKPICAPAQEVITKSHKEIITKTTDNPSGALSTQTEYNVIENIVTVNRTTKTLDHAYEQAGEYTIPFVKTSLIPDNISQPQTRSNQTYSTEPTSERRHSLLLERLSVERQLPTSNIYQTDNAYNNYNMYEGSQTSLEPQSEILTESNVKPSTINKNQQWYSRKESLDNITTTGITPSPQWPPSQQCNQPHTQQQTAYTPQNLSYPSQYIPPTQPVFTEISTKDTYKTSMNSFNQNSYPSYTPKPSWVSSTVDPKPTLLSQPNQYSYSKNEPEIYQKPFQNRTAYVPPPWEQDVGYNVNNNLNHDLHQPQYVTTPIFNQQQPISSWKPPTNKFTKTTPTSYIPPAPNQSFVRRTATAADAPKMPGRKTYYSEYERRYITVPESTYIPTETKFQAQPDPSPKYYYDQQETVETVEPQWRKELREFTEKSQTSTHTLETSVRPPWEEDPKYVASSEITNTPIWSQSLKPRSFRERSVESEYTATTKEWTKTNTLGRGRPQSSYTKNNLERIPERIRGVSVDRYNPNSYQPPLSNEHPPVQSQTLNPAIHPKPHYNPNVPAYHGRASVEPREQPVYEQPRVWRETRAPPVQSRSFKYLQWITGTED